MPRTNETRHIKWHETCKWICTLDEIICNNKQRSNEDNADVNVKNWLIKVRDKVLKWNSSNCECDKSCHIG